MAASPIWLLELEAGQTWRFATRPVSWDGNYYAAGLDDPGSFNATLAFEEPTEVSVAFTLDVSQTPGFVPADVALGGTAKLLLWRDPDDSSTDPVVVLQGLLEDPEFGAVTEPFTASIVEVPWDDQGRVTSPTAVISSSTFSSFDTEVDIDGEYYPIVFGAPGSTTGPVMGSPAFYVDTGATDLIMVSDGAVLASSLKVYERDDNPTSAQNETIATGQDSLGRRYSRIDVTGWADLKLGGEYWLVWDNGGGLADPDEPTRPLVGAGSVIEWFLRRSTLRVDWGRLRAAKHALNAYRLDFYFLDDPDQPERPWAFLTDKVLPLLPVAVRTGPDGLYLAMFDPTTPATVGRVRLEAGRNCTRTSAVTAEDTSAVVNDFTLRYAMKADKDKPSAEVRVSGYQPTLDTYSATIPSAICKESVRRYGLKRAELTAEVVYDSSTAERMALVYVARHALPPLSVDYTLDDDESVMEVGDVVRLTDSELGWTDRTAHVWERRDGADVQVTLRLWTAIGRELR